VRRLEGLFSAQNAEQVPGLAEEPAADTHWKAGLADALLRASVLTWTARGQNADDRGGLTDS
jgi:hypothetical protein